MCITNISKRRPDAQVAAVPAHLLSSAPSLISQRLGYTGKQSFPAASYNTTYRNNVVNNSNNNNSNSAHYAVPANNLPYGSAACGAMSMPSAPLSPPHFLQPQQAEKQRPKRRRKPQKPGKTAKQNERHFVVHNYHDHAYDEDENDSEERYEGLAAGKRRGGVSTSFPLKLHTVLDQIEADGLSHVVSWQPHGRCFVIHQPKEFVGLLSEYFRQTKLTSFQRQLNLYGFQRLTRGRDAGGYYHELFLRGRQFLCKRMVRTKVKGTRFKAASSPEQEPNFYLMNHVQVTPQNSSDEASHGDASSHSGSNVVHVANIQQHQDVNSMQSFNNFSMATPVQRFPETLDPIPIQNSFASSMEPSPLAPTYEMNQLNQYQFNNSNTFPRPAAVSQTSGNMNNFNMGQQMQQQSVVNPAVILPFTFGKRPVVDSILDSAVDELFADNPSLEEVEDLDSIWQMEQEPVEDDTHLGDLLEQLLQE